MKLSAMTMGLVGGLLTLGSSALGAVKTYTIALFPEQPVNNTMQSYSLDPRLAEPFLRGAQIVGARLIIDFTPANGFNPADLGISLTVPHSDIDYTSWHIVGGTDMGWTGPGPYTANISTGVLNGMIHVGGRAIWFLDIYSAQPDLDPPAYSGTFGPNTRFELDYIPVPQTLVSTGDLICGDGAATFTARTSCDGAPTYTWQCLGGPALDWTTLTAGTNTVGGEFLVNASGIGTDTLTVNRGTGTWPTGGVGGADFLFRCVVDTAECEGITSDEVSPPVAPGFPAFAELAFPFTTCIGGDASFNVFPDGVAPFSFAWRKNGQPIDAVANPTAHESTLTLTNLKAGANGTYDCLVTDACGTTVSDGVTISICAADFDCADGATISDIFTFLNAWFAGESRADIDEADGVQITDIFAFLNLWFAGCP